MKIACWFVATLSSIQNGLILAKQDDEATREQGLTHRLRHEIERDLQARIIDGDRVPIDTYPWFSFPFFNLTDLDIDENLIDDEILDDDGFLRGGCGASLVAPDMLLTAAHCVENLFELAAFIGGFTVGQYCLEEVKTNCGQGFEFHYIDAIFPHPNYSADRGLIINDYAVIKLRDKSNIDPVPMDQNVFRPDYEEGKTLWAVGFGNTDNSTLDPTGPEYLLHAEVNYVDSKTCTEVYEESNPFFEILGIDFEDEPSILCAGNPGKGICQGDSGGPLYDEENNVLVGVTSFSSNVCSELPSGFSTVAAEWPWIQETICSNHGLDNNPDFCDSFSPKECKDGEALVTIDIKTMVTENDAWWGIYNHDSDETVAEKNTDYLRSSTYQHSYCVEEDVCTILYLEGLQYDADSTFEVKMNNITAEGEFSSINVKRVFFFPESCEPDIPNPFSGAWKFRVDFSLQLILGTLIGLMLV